MFADGHEKSHHLTLQHQLIYPDLFSLAMNWTLAIESKHKQHYISMRLKFYDLQKLNCLKN